MLHIGIVGCSAEGAALCYKTICTETPQLVGSHAHPEITMHTPSLSKYVEYLDSGNITGVGSLMLESSRILADAGADFLICPDNTIHQAFDWVAARSPRPWLNIADVVATEAVNRNFNQVGILGTSWLVQSSVYPDALTRKGLDYRRPSEEQVDKMNQIIMSQLVYGDFTPESIRYFQSVIEELKQAGCDAVALACTEIPLIINDSNCSLPALDSTRLLARSAINKAVLGSR